MVTMPEPLPLRSSFRDPSGFLFRRGGTLYRQVNTGYRDHYDHLFSSGLYDRLVERGWLVPHAECPDLTLACSDDAYRIIEPRELPFITYPYEWCFSAYKDAALQTLAVVTEAEKYGMTLKDASAYNVQFVHGKPIMIDTLSFEKYVPGTPWVGYRQFCHHFLNPLLLMAKCDLGLGKLMRLHIDGIPSELTATLLPISSWLSPKVALHVHLHAASQKRFARAEQLSTKSISRNAYLGFIDSLKSVIQTLRCPQIKTEWSDYYSETNYDDDAFVFKKKCVGDYVKQIQPATVWDLGANTGVFSRIAAATSAKVVAADIDPLAVERNFLAIRNDNVNNILPIVMDLGNPSPGVGWMNQERMSLAERGPCDMVFALALVHHLAISNNVPLSRIAEFFHGIGDSLVIEFVPKEDSQVKRLLATRADVFRDYTKAHFEDVFQRSFSILRSDDVPGSCRTLYLMQRSEH